MDYFENKCGMYCPPQRDMNKKFATDVLCGKKLLLSQSEVKRVSHAPNFKEFSVLNIWNNIKRTPNAAKMMKYFPDYSDKTLPSK